MDLGLAGTLAVVTGASRGIGRAVAEALAREGCPLLLVARDEAALEAARSQLAESWPVPVQAVAADLAKPAELDRVAGLGKQAGILVNNAGATVGGSLTATSERDWRDGLELKLFAYVALCRRFYPAMRAQGGGVIVNVIGSAADHPDPDHLIGSAACAAIAAFTRAVGRAGPADNIRVVGVSPGPTDTARMETLLRRTAGQRLGAADRWAELSRDRPFGRLAHPREIADAVAFLASPRSGYTSGTVLSIDGGS